MKRVSVLFGVGAALVLLPAALLCSWPARAQAPPGLAETAPPPPPPAGPLIAPASAPAPKRPEAEGIDGLLKRLEDIRAQKAELARQKAKLDRAEAEAAEQLAERFHQLKERLKKAGVAVEPVPNQELPPLPVGPLPGANQGAPVPPG